MNDLTTRHLIGPHLRRLLCGLGGLLLTPAALGTLPDPVHWERWSLAQEPEPAVPAVAAPATVEEGPTTPVVAETPAAALPVNAAAQPTAVKGPVGQFMTVGLVDDAVVSRLTNIALELGKRAANEKQTGILVLQIDPAATPTHHAQALARQLTSQAMQSVRTVAWVPSDLSGPQALIALACRDIVLHPAAGLGDLSRGATLEPDELQFALTLTQRAQNPKVVTSLVQAMADPATQLWRVSTRPAQNGPPVVRLVGQTELHELRTTNVPIDEAILIKEAGSTLLLRGQPASQWDILVSHLAENRAAVALLYQLPMEALREPVATAGLNVRVLKLRGTIDTPQQAFLERQIDQALSDKVQLLIVDIDSPGGMALASMQLASRLADLDPRTMRTVAYVPEMALSGAALVALGCQEIYLHPLAKMGAAGPIEMRPGQQFERAPEKVVSVLRAAARGLAEKTGRPTALAEAMVDRSLIVYEAKHKTDGRSWYFLDAELQSQPEWERIAAVPETNGELLLTVDGTRAHALQLAERPVQNWEELRQRLQIPTNLRVAAIEPTWVDSMVFVLNQPEIGVLLFVFGIGLIYLEVHFMTGLLGIGSVLCFALFFWSKALGGTAGWLEVILFTLGVGLLLIEIFMIPGFGVFGVSGILLMVSSLIMASQTFGNLEPNADWQQLGRTSIALAGGLFLLGIAIAILARFLPHIPLFEQMVLSPPDPLANAALALASAPAMSRPQLDLGSIVGRSVTMLRPAGKAQFGDNLVDVMTTGEFVEAGKSVEIVHVNGNTVTVRAVDPSA